VAKKVKNLKIGDEVIGNVFRTLDIGIAIHEPIEDGDDYILLELNATAERIDKLKRKDVIGRRLTENFPAVKDIGILDLFKEVYKTGKPLKLPAVEYIDNRISGYRKTSIYKEPSGNLVVVYEDVTDEVKKEKAIEVEKDQAEEDLNERLKELNCLYEAYNITSKPDISVDTIFNQVLKILPEAFNDPKYTLCRATYKDKEYYKDDFKPTDFNIYSKLELYGEVLGSIEVFYKTDDNPHIGYEQKLLDGVARIILEKLQRREMIDILRTSEDKYRMIVENQTDIILRTDTETRYTYVSPSYCKLLGKTEKELLGAKAMDFVFEEDIPDTEKEVKKLFKPPYKALLVQRVKTKKGPVWYELTVRTNLDSDGNPRDFIAIGRNIEERKSFQEELDRKNKRLDCLYKVYSITSKTSLSIDEVFNETIRAMYGSFFDRENTYIKFIYEGKEYKLRDFKEAKDHYSEKIKSRSKTKGTVTLYYRPRDKSLLKEEKKLIKAVASILSMEIQRRETNKLLKDNEDKYRVLIENQTDLIIKTDADANYLYVSPAFLKVTGKKEDELIGNQAMDLVYEEDKESTQKQMKSLYKPPYRARIIQRVKTKKGLNWYEWSVKANIGKDKKIKELISVGRNIDERKRFEEELNMKHQQLRTLIDNIPDSIFIKDIKGRFMLNNRAHLKLLGAKSFKSVLGKTDFDYLPEYLSNSAKQDEDKIISTGRPMISTEEMIVNRETKKNNYFMTTKLPLKDDQGNVVGLIGIARDITSLREYSDKLQASNKELQQFAYVASHDLQEPLRVLSGFTQLLFSEYGDELKGEANEYKDYILDATDRMKNLISDLLEYSRVGTRGRPFTLVNMEKLIEEVLLNLDTLVKENNAKVQYSDFPEIIADKGQMSQLFQNLISNAIKFKGEKDPIINISIKKEKNQYHVKVEDNGIGIEKKFKERIFQVFERLHTREQYEGTGIGLAICRKIVERHNGRIWVVSKPGNGSKFHFTIKSDKEENIGGESKGS